MSNVDLGRGQCVYQVVHARARICGVLALRKARYQFAKRVESLPRRLRVALGHVLLREVTHKSQIFVEVDPPLQVVRVIDVWMIGVQLYETFAGGKRLGDFTVLPVGVGSFDLRHLRITTVWISRFQLLVVADRLLVVLAVEFLARGAVDPLRAPVLGFVHRPQRAARGQQHGKNRYTTSHDGIRNKIGELYRNPFV
jgi:hypothetical protein